MKNHILKLLFFTCIFNAGISFSAFAQEQNEKEEAITFAEQMPEYPGGHRAMFEFISKNITYPDKALENNTTGIVFVQFIVNKDGSLSDAKIIKGLSPELDEEALRVVNMMPDWKPGKQNGRAVNVYIKLPIKFSIASDPPNQKR